ncbi:PucR family transcriptional regulator [Sphaerisporangium fuscum]|uniref:PucR family transcriptional regulator n=1 Tax=Sphaerisporangium fuscum TaxID=2835868 RepID=UPI001BDD62CE|nr:PucR family transcriptional regulator [Sphaerisporangium fuscum]
MPLTVADVLTAPGLSIRLLAGRDGLANPVRWAHVTELPDPVPWLRGGELVMTVGLGLPDTPDGRRAYVDRLAAAGCAGLAFALDERLAAVPPEVLESGTRLRLPVLEITGRTPFIAVAEMVAQWHADERVRGERRTVGGQEAMARAALRAGPAGILRALAEHTGGETLLLDPSGRPRAAAPDAPRPWHDDAVRTVGDLPARHSAVAVDRGDQVLLMQSLGFTGPPRGWLALSAQGPTDWHVRVLANQAACLLAIELDGVRRTRARAHAQRAAVLAGVLTGDPAFAPSRLAEICPIAPPPYEVVVARPFARSAAEEPAPEVARLADPAIDAVADVLGDQATEELAFVCARPEGLVLVLPDTGRRLGGELIDRLASLSGREIAAGGCRARDLDEIPAAVRHAARLAGRRGSGYAHVDDMEPWALLRDALDPGGVSLFADTVLRPLRDHDVRHGTDLVVSVHAFLECGENVEAAARRIGVHRNTLRTRLRTAERLSGGAFSDSSHRLRLWLALALSSVVPPGRED